MFAPVFFKKIIFGQRRGSLNMQGLFLLLGETEREIEVCMMPFLGPGGNTVQCGKGREERRRRKLCSWLHNLQ